MAIRELKGRASPFQVYWNNPFTGKRESACYQTREEAEKENSLIKHRLKFERESFRPQEEEAAERESLQEITLEQAYYLYLKEKQFSRKDLGWQLGSMKMPLQHLGNKNIAQINKDDLLVLQQSLSSLPVKALTIRGYLNVLRAVLNWAADRNLCPKPDFPRMPKAEAERFIPPTFEEIDKMLQYAPAHVCRILIIGSQCGLRVGPSELFALKWKHIDFTCRIIHVPGVKKNPRAAWREVPVPDNLMDILKKWWLDDGEKTDFYVIHYNGKPVKSIKRTWKKILNQAGINRHIRPYDLRHTYATELIANGADIGTVAKLMGHSSPTMILNHYQYVMDRQKRDAIATLPELQYVRKKMCANKKGITEIQ